MLLYLYWTILFLCYCSRLILYGCSYNNNIFLNHRFSNMLVFFSFRTIMSPIDAETFALTQLNALNVCMYVCAYQLLEDERVTLSEYLNSHQLKNSNCQPIQGTYSVLRITCLTHFSIVIATCWIFRRYVDCFQRWFLNKIIRHVQRTSWVNRHAIELCAYNLRVIIVSHIGPCRREDFPLCHYSFLSNSFSTPFCARRLSARPVYVFGLAIYCARMCPVQISLTVFSSLWFSFFLIYISQLKMHIFAYVYHGWNLW